MINGNNTICMNPVYKQPTCFADKTMGCYTGTALLMLSSNVIESRKIQGCFTRRNRRSTLHDTSTFQGDKGPIRPYKRIKNTNFISNVTFCYNEVCNV
uniref:Uncharacterized protein n=1 Tax=Parastrongyloides trichosuri TaxID=131310 RepID=A0A0N4Z449_PARTI